MVRIHIEINSLPNNVILANHHHHHEDTTPEFHSPILSISFVSYSFFIIKSISSSIKGWTDRAPLWKSKQSNDHQKGKSTGQKITSSQFHNINKQKQQGCYDPIPLALLLILISSVHFPLFGRPERALCVLFVLLFVLLFVYFPLPSFPSNSDVSVCLSIDWFCPH